MTDNDTEKAAKLHLPTTTKKPGIPNLRRLHSVATVQQLPAALLPVEDDQSEHNLVRARNAITRSEKVTSTFGVRLDEIRKAVNTGQTDKAREIIQERLLLTLVDLLPAAEARLRESKMHKGTGQLTGLVTSIRELLIDVQSSEDSDLVLNSITNQILQPAFMGLAQMAVESRATLLRGLAPIIKEGEVREAQRLADDMTRNLAEYFSLTYRQISDQIKEAILDKNQGSTHNEKAPKTGKGKAGR